MRTEGEDELEKFLWAYHFVFHDQERGTPGERSISLRIEEKLIESRSTLLALLVLLVLAFMQTFFHPTPVHNKIRTALPLYGTELATER